MWCLWTLCFLILIHFAASAWIQDSDLPKSFPIGTDSLLERAKEHILVENELPGATTTFGGAPIGTDDSLLERAKEHILAGN